MKEIILGFMFLFIIFFLFFIMKKMDIFIDKTIIKKPYKKEETYIVIIDEKNKE